MSVIESKKFRHQALGHIHISYAIPEPRFYLNIVSVDAETIVSGKKFSMLIILCVKSFLSIEV